MEDNICTHLRNARDLVGDNTLMARILDALINEHCSETDEEESRPPGPSTPPPGG